MVRRLALWRWTCRDAPGYRRRPGHSNSSHARGEKVERFRRGDVETEAARLKAQIEAWCGGITPMLRTARPQLPEELTDRQQDGAEALLATGDLAGGEWPQATRR